MKIIVDGENIVENYLPVDPSDTRWKFPFCLPTDSDGKYFVSSDGIDFISVDEKLLFEYPYVKINYYYGSEYRGVSKQGISLLVFEINDEFLDASQLELGIYPSFICTISGKIQLIFRLKDFIPIIAKQPTWFYLEDTIEKVSCHLNGELTDVVSNPYCNKVISYIYNTDGLNLEEINNVLTETRKNELKEHAHHARAKSGIRTAKIKSDKSIENILKVVAHLEKEGKPYTQKLVSKLCGRSRKTVNKHWPAIMKVIEGKK